MNGVGNLARWMGRIGLAGFVGLALLAFAGWTRLVWLPQQRAQIDELGSQARRTRHELAEMAAASSSAPMLQGADASPEQAWQALWHALPAADRRTDMQATVISTAESQGLRVASVQYQGARQPWSAQAGSVLWRERMLMPVEGSYAAVRAWLSLLLREPALSIDQLEIQRPDVASDRVKARVAVSLWWRGQEGKRR